MRSLTCLVSVIACNVTQLPRHPQAPEVLTGLLVVTSALVHNCVCLAGNFAGNKTRYTDCYAGRLPFDTIATDQEK